MNFNEMCKQGLGVAHMIYGPHNQESNGKYVDYIKSRESKKYPMKHEK